MFIIHLLNHNWHQQCVCFI